MKENRTVVISGASRGVGAEIAKLLAQLGWNVVILAKTTEPHRVLPGTIYSVAEEIKAFGGVVLPLKVDVRFEEQVRDAIAQVVDVFGGVDALINNASALPFDGSEKNLRLVHQVIVDGTHFCTEACLPYLQKSENPHVINIAPLLPMAEHWIEKYGAYAVAKRTVSEYAMKMVVEHHGIAWHTLWPEKMLHTSATVSIFGEEKARRCTRSPKIMADAVNLILESNNPYGSFWTDNWALKGLGGVTDFSRYLLSGSKEEDLIPDVFV